jgi:hypothetical protein
VRKGGSCSVPGRRIVWRRSAALPRSNLSSVPDKVDALRSWEACLGVYRDLEDRAKAYADLLDTVDPRWFAAIQVQNGVFDIRIFPVGDSLNQGSCLTVVKTASGFSMNIAHNPGMTIPEPVARRRATHDKAATVLAAMLEQLLEGRHLPPSQGDDAAWARLVADIRVYGQTVSNKVALLSPLGAKWAGRCEINDNYEHFGIIRAGDTAEDGRAVWISPTIRGWLLQLARQDPRNPSQLIRAVEADLQRVGEVLDELLAEMTADTIATETTAQDAYRCLLHEFVGPALRQRGYHGSRGDYQRTVGDYQLTISFQKSKWSRKERVEYRMNLDVQHPETVEAYNQANAEARAQGRAYEQAPAGAWFSTFPGNLGPPGQGWVSLRPIEDLSAHTAHLLKDLDTFVFPEIARQLALPLSTPTPLSARPNAPSRGS